MPQTRARRSPNPKTQPKNKKSSSTVQVKSTVIPDQYDTAKNLAIAGFIGLILTYIIGSRALNTGSYWEYLFTVILLIITLRLFIRSIRLK